MSARRNSVTVIALVSVTVWAAASCKPNSKTQLAKQPNILLIVADDLGFSDIGPYGGEISTPALDQLAREGVQLSNFHVLPTCSPTRSVLLSGMDNHRAGLGTMGEFVTPEMEGSPGYAGYLNFEVAPLPEVLKRAGYHTYMAGKWHLGSTEETSPHARGFEETFVLLQGGGSHWSDRKPLCPPETLVYRRNGKEVESLPEDFYSSRYYTDRMLEWIEQGRADGRPFFGYLAYTAPHDPLHAPAEYTAKYKGKYDQGWDALRQERLASLKRLGMVPEDAVPFPRLPNVKAWKKLSKKERALAARDMEVYAAMVDYMDEQIARVFDYLEGDRRVRQHDDPLHVRQRGQRCTAHRVPRSDRGVPRVVRQQPRQPRPSGLLHRDGTWLGAGEHVTKPHVQGLPDRRGHQGTALGQGCRQAG